mmetsp:Transcript_17778/g.26312  ORF Transcript_17778/g.26312 Transcript_17778/m.26312 type:complete len:934 (-) Transcript_17778:172-2973(-)|eukprot:CAMPEP_0194219964 /NCGR_PEP_ID=MMETSP0156-20130528/27223_1 /TAXON_ID=33649 /ORGANISM="Thalassionema nitzschioides, Strain L26-B" /LENGTH=933 /DNA_ID=CAMNT_0038949815 /DNA_START=159 /DNA_END=2960 /DNA_ORIENTATION=-
MKQYALLIAVGALLAPAVDSKLADRSRIVKARQQKDGGRYLDNGSPIAGPSYRSRRRDIEQNIERKQTAIEKKEQRKAKEAKAPWKMNIPTEREADVKMLDETPEEFQRKLSSQLTGCCYTYQGYDAATMCATYGQDCESGETPSHDSGDEDCSHDGLSFIGISFSVNTANGNPYSYQLCDQFPVENIIDRNYDYIMSMDEDGWLVGGGYKTFDYSGKMPYIDSSHTEVVRIGNMDPNSGGTSIDQVYSAMESITFAPFSIFPEYLKAGGGHHSGDNDDDGEGEAPSSDVTLVVSIVDTYEDDNSYSSYETFLEDLFDALDAVGGGPCMDDDDTDPHVSMSRGVKFWSSTHATSYYYEANLEIAVWQAMYPNGVPIGSNGYAAFPPGRGGSKVYVGYGNLYFFFDRSNITKAFMPNRDLTDNEKYYATLYKSSDVSSFYSSVTTIGFDYAGSHDDGDDDCSYEHNAYNWHASMAMHDMTDGWSLPPNCMQEGETFFGIPLSRSSSSKLQSTNSFQEQFDFEIFADRNNTYVDSFGTNHGWLVGEEPGNAIGSIVDKDTAHIPIFYAGTTNANMGGLSLSNMIKVAKTIDFGTLYIKPAFVYVDGNGHVKLQFEMDPNSALGYLYDNLCKELGITWNYESPYNTYGAYTNCAMHAASDRASYGCGPEGANSGGFCPQMTIAYSPRFYDEDSAAAYLEKCNDYVDYWRSLYPSGVAVGTSSFCPDGGCMGLFLNRYDLYQVFKPDLGGSWVEYNGASMPPTFSPAPTWKGGCDEPHNFHLDKCFRKRYKPKASAVAWDALGTVGQFSVLLVVFMAVTLSISIFLARARKKRRRGESYLGFFFRDLTRKKKSRRRKKNRDLEESMLPETSSRRSKSRSRRSSSRSRSKSRRSSSKGRSASSSGRSKSKDRRRSSSRPKSSSRGGEREESTKRQQLV